MKKDLKLTVRYEDVLVLTICNIHVLQQHVSTWWTKLQHRSNCTQLCREIEMGRYSQGCCASPVHFIIKDNFTMNFDKSNEQKNCRWILNSKQLGCPKCKLYNVDPNDLTWCNIDMKHWNQWLFKNSHCFAT